jgi:hypothetical protein
VVGESSGVLIELREAKVEDGRAGKLAAMYLLTVTESTGRERKAEKEREKEVTRGGERDRTRGREKKMRRKEEKRREESEEEDEAVKTTR